MRFFLIGFMGSGKTYVGKRLASRLKMNFIDLDGYIQSQTNSSITELFNKGEGYFRKIESEQLQRLIQNQTDVIISLGGGTPCFNDNMELILKSGYSIYLEMSPLVLKDRLKNNKEDRPLISNMNDHELLGFITETLAKREIDYYQANMIVPGINLKGKNLIELSQKLNQIRTT